MNIKNLSQTEYERYLILDLIPELKEELNGITHLIVRKDKVSFAKECEVCGGLLVHEEKYPIALEILEETEADINEYLGLLTELEIVGEDDVMPCECYEDERIDEEDECDELF